MMTVDRQDEEVATKISSLALAPSAVSFEEWHRLLTDCSDQALGHVYERSENIEERAKVLACMTVAILHDRYRSEVWPAHPPAWWPREKQYPPDQPYWAHVVGHFIGRSWSTAYRRYNDWLAWQRIVTIANVEPAEDLALELGKGARNLISTATDSEAALAEAMDLRAEVGEARPDMLAARLQERGLMPSAKWSYGCPCGCDWWGKQGEFLKRPAARA